MQVCAALDLDPMVVCSMTLHFDAQDLGAATATVEYLMKSDTDNKLSKVLKNYKLVPKDD